MLCHSGCLIGGGGGVKLKVLVCRLGANGSHSLVESGMFRA